MNLVEGQMAIENMFSRKGIKKAVLDYMATIPEVENRINQGVELINNWCQSPSSYASKQTRKDHVSQMDLKELVTDIFVRIASLSTETTLNNLASQLAPAIGFDDTRVGIQTMAEVLAVVCNTNFYHLVKYHVNSSVYVRSNFKLNDELQAYVERACYLPPMLSKPKTLRGNRDSGYLTIKGESLILGGSINHHNEPICLDVLNLMNRYKYTLNEWVLDNIKEEPTTDLNVVKDSHLMNTIDLQRAIAQQHQNWKKHLQQSAYFYNLIRMNGNKMYITVKPDKRGRLYMQGYHITPQGAAYKKASVDLYDKVKLEVPSDYFTSNTDI
ncbi:hypothetical protein nACB1_087 [Acinetobacter phage nACB1]|nr:hypothetical protein nACB1_087 [Acinetobacter phage nACB1]